MALNDKKKSLRTGRCTRDMLCSEVCIILPVVRTVSTRELVSEPPSLPPVPLHTEDRNGLSGHSTHTS